MMKMFKVLTKRSKRRAEKNVPLGIYASNRLRGDKDAWVTNETNLASQAWFLFEYPWKHDYDGNPP